MNLKSLHLPLSLFFVFALHACGGGGSKAADSTPADANSNAPTNTDANGASAPQATPAQPSCYDLKSAEDRIVADVQALNSAVEDDYLRSKSTSRTTAPVRAALASFEQTYQGLTCQLLRYPDAASFAAAMRPVLAKLDKVIAAIRDAQF